MVLCDTCSATSVAQSQLTQFCQIPRHRTLYYSLWTPFLSRLPSSGGTWKYAKAPSTKKVGEILYLLIWSFLPCLSWLLRSRVRKSRRDLRITLYVEAWVVFGVAKVQVARNPSVCQRPQNRYHLIKRIVLQISDLIDTAIYLLISSSELATKQHVFMVYVQCWLTIFILRSSINLANEPAVPYPIFHSVSSPHVRVSDVRISPSPYPNFISVLNLLDAFHFHFWMQLATLGFF